MPLIQQYWPVEILCPNCEMLCHEAWAVECLYDLKKCKVSQCSSCEQKFVIEMKAVLKPKISKIYDDRKKKPIEGVDNAEQGNDNEMLYISLSPEKWVRIKWRGILLWSGSIKDKSIEDYVSAMPRQIIEYRKAGDRSKLTAEEINDLTIRISVYSRYIVAGIKNLNDYMPVIGIKI